MGTNANFGRTTTKTLLLSLLTPMFQARTKYLEVDFHYVRELVVAGTLNVCYIPSHLQVAYIFTKGLPLDQFLFLKSNLIHTGSLSLLGDDIPHNSQRKYVDSLNQTHNQAGHLLDNEGQSC